MCSPVAHRDAEIDVRPTETPVETKVDRPKTPDVALKETTAEPSIHAEQRPSIRLPVKEENHDIKNMESSAAEALMTLAGQDNIIRHKSPGQVQPNIIRALQSMSSKYINDEPILKESEKIEMFSEIPTTDSEEESLEIRRLRYENSLRVIRLKMHLFNIRIRIFSTRESLRLNVIRLSHSKQIYIQMVIRK